MWHFSLATGSTDFFVESFHYIEGFYGGARLIPDDYFIHAAQARPSDNWAMSGSQVCRGNYPHDYSILIKFLPPPERFSVTLLNISDDRNGLAITLDLCSNAVNLTFGSDCPLGVLSFPLADDFDTKSKKWHRIGFSFSEASISVFGDCKGDFNDGRPPDLLHHVPLDLSECRVHPCDDDVNIHIMQPTRSPHCSSDEEVRLD